MGINENRVDLDRRQDREIMAKEDDKRVMLIGTLSLVTLVFLALVIRNLFADLNPLILAGLSTVTYGVYLGALMLSRFARLNKDKSAVEPVKADIREN